MKILLILDHYYPVIGGAEVLNQHLAELLAAEHEVTVLTQLTTGTVAFEELRGVKIYRVATFHRATFPYQAFQLAKNLAQDADVIQAAPYSAGILASKLRPYTTAKIVLLVYECLGARWLQLGMLGWQAFLIEKQLFLHQFDHYVAISESTKKQLRKIGIPNERITLIYCGIDNDFFVPRDKNIILRKQLNIDLETFLVLFAGRPGVTKGVFLLLEAMREKQKAKSRKQNGDLGGEQGVGSKEQSMKMKLVLMLGREPAAQRLRVEKLIRRYQLHDEILVLDSVARTQLPSYMSMADAVIVPSLSEGFGFLGAEVSAMKIPLIVSKVDALPEVVSGEVIFIDKPTPTAIVQALDKAQKKQFSLIPARSFSWAETVKQYLSLYQALRN